MNINNEGSRKFQIVFAYILILSFLLSGCESITLQSLTPRDVIVQNKNDSTVSIRVTGFPLHRHFRVTKQLFSQALKASLTNTGVFSKILIGDTDYRLDIHVYNTRSSFGYTATIEARWWLTKVESNKVIWQEVISTQHKSNYLGGATRYKRSVSGAIKKNIKQGIQNLSRHIN